jgi:hypothetical protein
MGIPRPANAHAHIPQSAEALPKVMTHIEELDTVFQGGLPAGRTTLILRGDCRFLRDGGTIARIVFPKAVAAAGAEP